MRRDQRIRPGVTPRRPVTNHLRSTPFEARLLAIAFRDWRYDETEVVYNNLRGLNFGSWYYLRRGSAIFCRTVN